jgi:PmbA protein
MPQKEFAYSIDQFKEIAEKTLKMAKGLGASSVEVDLNEGLGSEVSVRKGDIENLEYNRDKGLGITVYVGQRKGYASTSDLGEGAIAHTVEAAVSIAQLTAEDSFSGLADQDRLAQEVSDLDLYHPWHISMEDSIDLARECEQAAFDVSPEIRNSEGASVAVQEGQFVYANSNGFMQGFPSTRHYISCSVTAGEGDQMQRDGWWSTARCAEDMESAHEIGKQSGIRALGKVGAKKINTKKIPVIFEAPVASGMLRHFISAVSGGNLYRQQSFLEGAIGEIVFPELLSIEEDPFVPRGLASGSFDNEGVQTAKRSVVSAGRLEGLFLSTYSARKLGLASTGNAGGSHNLFVRSSAATREFSDLLKMMGTGFLITDLLGHGTNMVTGDYSRGASGFWVENGEIAYPVQEVTVAGNLKDMFKSISAIGNDVLSRSSFKVGSILIDSMTVGGE